MKPILFFLFLLAISVGSAEAKGKQPDPYPHNTDKLLHLAWGAGTEAGISLLGSKFGLSNSPEWGFAGAVATGIAKELADKNFDAWDAVATISGGLAAWSIDRTARIYIEKRPGGGILNFSSEF